MEEKSSVYNEGAVRDIGIAGQSSQLPLDQQEKEIAVLHQTIDQLLSRLHMVLTPVGDKEGLTVGNPESPMVSPLAEQLHANNRGISGASGKLKHLMERLEI